MQSGREGEKGKGRGGEETGGGGGGSEKNTKKGEQNIKKRFIKDDKICRG
jgi:hypothetical protein